ncbi:MAG: sugar ABC transporter permease [Oscillospiraceae bacterium]|nr:sugar ABC transporter permease [Oscillospiraceae bacterium]
MRNSLKTAEQKVEVRKGKLKKIYQDRSLYMLVLPSILTIFFFRYLTMPGVLMAFQNFKIFDGIAGSQWVGLDNARKILSQGALKAAVGNTVFLSIGSLVFSFPCPIFLSLLIIEVQNQKFKKVIQTLSYLPHFLSWMAIVGLIQLVFGRDGLINDFRMWLGAEERIMYLAQQKNFVPLILGTGLWQGLGWSTILHLANLSAINPELYEAAEIDGAGYFQRLKYITFPHMMPSIVLQLIFRVGGIFGDNFELIYGLQNPFIDYEVISTIVMKTGVLNGQYSLSVCMSLIMACLSLLLTLGVNWFSKKVTGTGIF